MLYLTSTAIIPAGADGVWTKTTISVNSAKDIWRRASEKMSAIGHESTASLIAKLLDQDKILMNRLTVQPEPGDQFLVFQLTQRPPEGVVLSIEQLELLGHTWSIMEYTSGPGLREAMDVSVLQKKVEAIRRELEHRLGGFIERTEYPY